MPFVRFAARATRLLSAMFAGVAVPNTLQLGYAAVERVATGKDSAHQEGRMR